MSLEVDPVASSRLRAVAHPIRLQILSLLTSTAMSAAEVARELGISQANASYHLRVLATAEHLVAAGEEKIRGGIAKRYHHPWQEGSVRDEDTPRTPDSGRMFIEAICSELVRRQSYAGNGPEYTADADMWVNPDVWNEVLALSAKAGALVHDRAQPPRTEGTIHVNLTTVAFTMEHQPESSPAKVEFIAPKAKKPSEG